ncbi:RadC family protein [Flocculibacter collagenilyticus]|uniref:RadC family protein n=1 Tax=Flocculibacter collagenilyticus TaxID=2744479 RepID=UPI0018F6DB13|nr:DNA repair protein RadC [Flocculibacter collagenilyticus]
MQITALPQHDRPREKLLIKGAHALSDAELLAIFLRTGIKGVNAIELAMQLLEQFGSLRELLSSPYDNFCEKKGLGQAKFVQLQAVMEMARRYYHETLEREDALTSPDAVKQYLSAQLRDQPYEVFACMYLDSQHRVIKFEPLFYGTIDSAAVYPRVVVQKVLEKNAAAVILSHNHPSGVAEPSQADKVITRRLQEALKLIDVRVLDHFVVGDGNIVSFAERGLI